MPPLSEACAVLTAAGSGSRLGCEVPKALVELSGRPLVWWAARGLRAGGVGTIVVTAPAASLDEFRAGIADIGGVEVVAGSDRSRQASVALGLAALGQRNPGDVVLVHDAARPLTPAQTPQGFRWDVLTRAHEAGASLGADEAVAATDDAGLVEAIGAVVHTVAGDERSLKVTRPLDLSLAQLLAGQERLD